MAVKLCWVRHCVERVVGKRDDILNNGIVNLSSPDTVTHKLSCGNTANCEKQIVTDITRWMVMIIQEYSSKCAALDWQGRKTE